MPVISTNNAANASLNYLNQNSATSTQLLSQLASGSRIVNASDDAAGLAIGTQLQASVAVYQQNTTNVAQGTSILQAADGAMAQIGNVLQRMLALATQSASGQVSDAQRSDDIQTEFAQLQSEIDTIVNSTTYAGTKLLGGTFSSTDFLVGTTSSDKINVQVTGSTGLYASTLSVNSAGASVSTISAAGSAMSTVTNAINTITQQRAKVGAYESQFNFSSQVLATNIQNVTAAASVIMDADVASVKANLSAADVKMQASVAALAQAAQLPQNLLRLIQG